MIQKAIKYFILSRALLILIIVFLISCNSKQDQPQLGNLIEELLSANTEHYASFLNQLDKYEIQIIYTQVNRDSVNQPNFKSHYFNVDSSRYFYPASTVKMPIAILALEKLKELGIDKTTTLLTDSAYSGQRAVWKDTTSKSGMPSIAHYIKKIFLVSDDDAYNRLYEFLGPRYIRAKLEEKGFDDSRIIHRLSLPLTVEENQHTNPVKFVINDSVIYQQPLTYAVLDYQPENRILKGEAYMDTHDSLIQESFDFTYKNFMPLDEMQRMLRSIIFPNTDSVFRLQADDYQFVHQYLSQLPSETTYPSYDSTEFFDTYSKLFMFGDTHEMPDHIRVFNKIGEAYGYLIDNAYIVDFESNIEFFLSAVILVNDNQTYNDNQYEYKKIGIPFLAHLGRTIHEYELSRPRTYQPDLSNFIMTYDQ